MYIPTYHYNVHNNVFKKIYFTISCDKIKHCTKICMQDEGGLVQTTEFQIMIYGQFRLVLFKSDIFSIFELLTDIK